MDPRHVEAVVDAADVIQIGARNMQNFVAARRGRPRAEAGAAEARPVGDGRGAADGGRVRREGGEPPRSSSASAGSRRSRRSTRYTLDLGAVAVLKQETHLPVIVDPSHAAGRRDLVLPLARAAVAAGADGIIVEAHPRPEEALCDGPQQIPIGGVRRVRRRGPRARPLMGKQVGATYARRAGLGARRCRRPSPGVTSRSRTAPCCSGRSRRARRRITRLRPLRRHAATVDAVRASASRSTTTATTSSSCGASGCAAWSPDGRSTAATRARCCGSLAGSLAGQRGPLRADRRRVAVAAADGARRRAAAPMGAHVETTDGHAPARRRGRRAARDRVRAPGRERAGEVGDPARGPLRRRRPDDGGRADADARPHRADARRLRASRVRRGAEVGLGLAGRRACGRGRARHRRATSRRRRR